MRVNSHQQSMCVCVGGRSVVSVVVICVYNQCSDGCVQVHPCEHPAGALFVCSQLNAHAPHECHNSLYSL